MVTVGSPRVEAAEERDRLLAEIQNRVLWLAVKMVHHANHERPNPDGTKVGGHQASSSSVVTIMTYLFFEHMRAGDRLSVKPHASPVYHAIQFLLGRLEGRYLRRFRALGGLQAYPSRTKDPDGVDFSTGSVGLGAVAPNFAALVDEYIATHFPGDSRPHRYISLVGDAELDEGSVWEAISDPALQDLEKVLWVVDLNRQSLDRIIPGIRVRCWREMFAANGWNVVDAKYGRRLQEAFALPNGELLRNCIDEMSNETYQRLLRLPPEELREWLPKTSRYPRDLARFIDRWDDEELQELIRNLGGHDFATLREAFQRADAVGGPVVIFAYTLKGWMLPSVGDPQNHTVLLSARQMEALREALGVPAGEEWSAFPPDSPAGRLCAETRRRLYPEPSPASTAPQLEVPTDLGYGGYRGLMSTQQVFGLVLTDIARDLPHLATHMVTVSPDVASSTNLGGWINKVGVWARKEGEPLPQESINRALKWEESPTGQHIELGITENNLFMMLGQLGLSQELHGQLLFPIGTLYDPFVRRGLDAFVYGLYSGARFIVVGTPSGITLAPEGGAHQSVITPGIGAELPDIAFYEPCFGQELEWILLWALENILRRRESTYLRLTSKPVDQSLFRLPDGPEERERLRRQVLRGAYRLVDRRGERDYRPGENVVNVFASGAVVPEAVEASRLLLEEGVMANVVNVTGPGPLYRYFQRCVRDKLHADGPGFMADVLEGRERRAPVVTLVDGHPHSLAWIGGALGAPTYPLGVDRFGQSGSRTDLYREYQIDVEAVMAACFAALEDQEGLTEG